MKQWVRCAVAPLAVLSALAVGGEAAAQQESLVRTPQIGQRVRILAPELRRERYVGRVEALPRDSIMLDTTGARRRLGFDTGPVLVEEFRRVTIPNRLIEAIDLSVGRTTRRSTIKGALIGAVAGGGLFGAANLPEINPGFRDFLDGAALGAVIGAVAGGVVGYLLGGERWEPLYRATVLPPP